MVCDVFCKDDECDGHECKHNFADARPSERCGDAARCCLNSLADVARDEFFDCFDESEVGIRKECLNFVACACCCVAERCKVVDKGLPVDYLEIFDVEAVSENREEGSHDVACADADDERDKASHLEFLLSGANADGDERHKTAEECDKVVASVDGCAACRDDVTHCVACKRKSDDCDGRSDDDRGHEFRHPFAACKLDDYCQNHVNETCKDTTENDSAISECQRR